jgi:hypothetical protein
MDLRFRCTQHVTSNANIIFNFKCVMVAPMIATRGEPGNVAGKGIIFI